MEKCAKDQANFFLPTFPLIEKSAKDQADGKCHRTGLFPPTVGLAFARVVRTIYFPSESQDKKKRVTISSHPLTL